MRAIYDVETGQVTATVSARADQIRAASVEIPAQDVAAVCADPSAWRVIDGVLTHIGRKPTTDEINAEAQRRILQIAPIWRQINLARENPSDPIFAQIDAIRAASDALIDADPRPQDFTSDTHWQGGQNEQEFQIQS